MTGDPVLVGSGSQSAVGRWQWSEFNVVTSSFFEGVFLLFNTSSGSLRQLDSAQAKVASAWSSQTATQVTRSELGAIGLEATTLVHEGFIVDVGSDERGLIRRLYWARREASLEGLTQALNLTVNPTVSCNFRCTYCFEQHPNRTFTTEDIESAAALVRKRLAPEGSLSILWFGGEPLSRFRVLQDIYSALKVEVDKLGGTLSHSMISNGYLLDEQKVTWLADSGLSSIQVTLDGNAATHNSRRPTVGGRGTFDRILDNIGNAVSRIPIELRVNVDRRNLKEVNGLLDELVARGLNRQPLAVYLGWVRGYTDLASPDASPNQLTGPEYARAGMRLRYELIRRGFRSGMEMNYPRRSDATLCTADNPNGFVLSPGRLSFRCWNEAADDHVNAPQVVLADGSLAAGPSHERRARWEEYDPFTHTECQSCLVQPLCRGGCPWISREKPADGPGDCTTLRWVLEEQIQLTHLLKGRSAAAKLAVEQDFDLLPSSSGGATDPLGSKPEGRVRSGS